LFVDSIDIEKAVDDGERIGSQSNLKSFLVKYIEYLPGSIEMILFSGFAAEGTSGK
jgi:hypothetical protein